jgi:hypothetical protein
MSTYIWRLQRRGRTTGLRVSRVVRRQPRLLSWSNKSRASRTPTTKGHLYTYFILSCYPKNTRTILQLCDCGWQSVHHEKTLEHAFCDMWYGRSRMRDTRRNCISLSRGASENDAWSRTSLFIQVHHDAASFLLEFLQLLAVCLCERECTWLCVSCAEIVAGQYWAERWLHNVEDSQRLHKNYR